MSRASKHARFFVFAFAALLAGCSDDSSDSNDGDGSGDGDVSLPDPCAFLSTASLEPIIGKDIVDSEKSGGSTPRCVWFDAEDNRLMTIALYASSDTFDAPRAGAPSVPGLGADAYLYTQATVWVKMPNGVAFMAQSLLPVADGQVSSQIQTAAAGQSDDEVLTYEASYRLAKIIVSEL